MLYELNRWLQQRRALKVQLAEVTMQRDKLASDKFHNDRQWRFQMDREHELKGKLEAERNRGFELKAEIAHLRLRLGETTMERAEQQ